MTVVGDQCAYGLETWSADGKTMVAAKKRTKFMTNSVALAMELSRISRGQPSHPKHLKPARTSSRSFVYRLGHYIWLRGGGRPAAAARYPDDLCRAICRGVATELGWKEKCVKMLMAVNSKDEIEEDHKNTHDEEETEKIMQKAWDDVSGMELDVKEVIKARREEIDYIRKKEVWQKIPRRVAEKRGWRIIRGGRCCLHFACNIFYLYYYRYYSY